MASVFDSKYFFGVMTAIAIAALLEYRQKIFSNALNSLGVMKFFSDAAAFLGLHANNLFLILVLTIFLYVVFRQRQTIALRAIVPLTHAQNSLLSGGALEHRQWAELNYHYEPDVMSYQAVDATTEKPHHQLVYRKKNVPTASKLAPLYVLADYAAGLIPNPAGQRLRVLKPADKAMVDNRAFDVSKLSLVSDGFTREDAYQQLVRSVQELPPEERTEYLSKALPARQEPVFQETPVKK